MPEVFLEIFGDTSLWLLFLLLIPLYFWGKLNHDVLYNYHAYPDSFSRLIEWLREDNFGRLYLQTLGYFLDKISDWIGDRHKISQDSSLSAHKKGLIDNFFGFNPFSSSSFDKALRLAFLYPLLLVYISWLFGGTGKILGIDYIYVDIYKQNNIIFDNVNPWLMIFWMFLIAIMLIITWISRCYKSWYPWLIVTCLIAAASLFVAFNPLFMIYNSIPHNNMDIIFSFVAYFIFGWIMFFSLFFSLYLGGWVTAYFAYGSVKLAHKKIYWDSFIIVFSFFVAMVVSIVPYMIKSYSIAITIGPAAVILSLFVIILFAGAGSLAVIFAFFGGNADVIPFYFSIMVAGFLTMASRVLRELAEYKEVSGRFWFFYTSSFFVLGVIFFALSVGNSSLASINKLSMVSLIMLVLLPLLNAPLDWLSLGVTRGLLQAIRMGKHSGGVSLAFASVDLLLALIFLLLITAIIISVVTLGNVVAGETLINIESVLQSVRANPTNVDHWWIYFMLLSTLIPTLVHFALAGGAATLWLPRKTRLWLVDGIENDLHKKFLAWAYLTFTPIVGFVLMPGTLLYFLWWLVNVNSGWLGMRLLDWAEMLAHFANPAMQ